MQEAIIDCRASVVPVPWLYSTPGAVLVGATGTVAVDALHCTIDDGAWIVGYYATAER
jgi:hypothetical protein